MQSRDRAAPFRRARRGLAGDRRPHHPSDPHTAPACPAASTSATTARRRSPRRAACPTRPDTQYASYILETPRAGRRVGYGHRLLHLLLLLLLLRFLLRRRRHGRYVYADSTRRRPPSATSIMTPAPRRPHAHAVLPAVVLSRERDRPRYVCLYVNVRVCLCERGG